ncbi:hypothetical protein CK203_043989 [Vitis vinifera]|uniref:DUF4283 domain-containing protein n=1 Tax=Vitis vinifera TaxID=29760 RepID=A0A438HTH8_VITVI|nr:hypothetical protein CK203_043989 [Vitis vinifera]
MKTFQVKFEGESGGTWCSLSEHGKGFVFSLGFEKEKVGWLIEHLAKVVELKSYMGFNIKYKGKSRAHLMEVVRALARFLGQKGVVTIVPFSIGKGLPFHLWSKEHLKKIVEQWGTVVEINWRTVKLFDLSKARVRISMKECTVLPALIKVKDGEWVFTILVAMAEIEDERWVRGMCESTQGRLESHSQIDGKRMVEKPNPMAKGWSFNGDFGKIQGGVESQKGEDAFEGHMARRVHQWGITMSHPSLSLI